MYNFLVFFSLFGSLFSFLHTTIQNVIYNSFLFLQLVSEVDTYFSQSQGAYDSVEKLVSRTGEVA